MPTSLHVQYVVDAHGTPKNALLPIEEFEELVECAEDVMDGAEIERLRTEPRFAWTRVKAEKSARKSE